MKICTGCKESLDESHFTKMTISKDGLNPRCRSCVSDYAKIYVANNKDKIRKAAKARNLAKKSKGD